ncbi:hypothetical protein HYX13_01850 [Candidatus Woesearchaeota archaeon]|nr:hypothetical protein [Candidatus Woesearchaeota archaeon]
MKKQFNSGYEQDLPRNVSLVEVLSREQELRSILASGCSIALVHLDAELDHLLQINYVATEHMVKFTENQLESLGF